MAKVQSTLGRPIQGVSQQPYKERRDGQCSEQVNMNPSVVEGLKVRPGTIYIKNIIQSYGLPQKTHHYRRGDGEEYFICFIPNQLPRIFNTLGTEMVVEDHTGGSLSYVATANTSNLNAVTIADYTFVINKDKTVSSAISNTAPLTSDALVYLQFATYGKTYTVSIDGTVLATYTAPDGSLPAHAALVDTSYVIQQLFNQLSVATDPNYIVTVSDNVIYLKKVLGDFSITCSDGASGNDLIAVKGRVSDIGKLPPNAPVGFMVKVQQSGKSDELGFWLKAVGTDGDSIKWVESIAPNTNLGFDKATMPHVIVRDSISGGIATFKVMKGDWSDRDVGDLISNPNPAFLDNELPMKISTIGTFQGRLFMTAGETVTMSRSGDFFNFFRTTTQTIVDSDPVSGYADGNQINNIYHAVGLDGDLILFSSDAQFKIAGDVPVTPENFTISNTTSFESQSGAPPVASGESLFFAFSNGQFTGLREYFTDSETDTKRARPITEHVDRYIKGGARFLATSPNANWLAVASTVQGNVLYMYNWLWLGNEKVQSAWHKWEFGGVVVSVHFSVDVMYLLISRFGNLFLEKIELNDNQDELLGFEVRLDCRRNVNLLVQPDGSWLFNDPLPFEDIDNLRFIRRGYTYPAEAGLPARFERFGGLLVCNEDIAGGPSSQIVMGIKYTASYTPSQPLIRDFKDRVNSNDPLTVSRYSVHYELSGTVKMSTNRKYGGERVIERNGRVIGEPNNIVGFSQPTSGTYVVPIMERSENYTFTISTDDYVPFELREIEWTGQYSQSGRRV